MVALINSWLSKQGLNTYDTPIFRLVWSEEQTELRRGTFNEFQGSIFLRTSSGVRRVKKYPFIHSRWVLEKWFPPEVVYHEDLPESRQGSYEPLFVFEDKHGDPLPLNLRVIQLIVSFDRSPRESFAVRKSALLAESESRDAQELKTFIDMIDTSDIQSLLHSREAIVNPYGREKYGGH